MPSMNVSLLVIMTKAVQSQGDLRPKGRFWVNIPTLDV